MNALSVRDIASRHRLRRSGRDWRGDCPACGYADALVLTEGAHGRALAWCASCQDSGAVLRAVGVPPVARAPDPAAHAKRAADRARTRDRALALWRGSESVAGSPAAVYLASRGIGHLTDCPDLRFRPDCPHPQGGKLPAMVALVRGPDGEPAGIHRTFLRRDGAGKADVTLSKASLGPIWGGSIRLARIGPELVVGEGIETAGAAGLLAGLPAWAALSAGNLATGLAMPETVRSVVIAVDRDPAGERAADAAARRWRAEGRRVRLLIPDLPGTDAADVLLAREVTHA